MLNEIKLIGRLGRSPEIKTFENGNKKASFAMATSETYKNKEGEKIEKTEWHNVYFFGKVADIIERYVTKGMLVYISGTSRTRKYEKDGSMRYVTEVEGNTIKMLSKDEKKQNKSEVRNTTVTTTESPSVTGGATDEPNDDLPF